MVVFDIETGPLPYEEVVKRMPKMPEDAGIPDPGKFDPGKVLVGNLKDPEKIKAKIDEARANHEALAAKIPAMRQAKVDSEAKQFFERAALSATTGRVLAVGFKGYMGPGIDHKIIHTDFDEQDVLSETLAFLGKLAGDGDTIVGFNIFRFDLPFLVRRAWHLGVDVPDWLKLRNGRYWNPVFVDLLDLWMLGSNRPNDSITLDELAQSLGVGQKTEGVTGADFAKLYFGSEAEREQALVYLRNDLDMTYAVAQSLQV